MDGRRATTTDKGLKIWEEGNRPNDLERERDAYIHHCYLVHYNIIDSSRTLVGMKTDAGAGEEGQGELEG